MEAVENEFSVDLGFQIEEGLASFFRDAGFAKIGETEIQVVITDSHEEEESPHLGIYVEEINYATHPRIRVVDFRLQFVYSNDDLRISGGDFSVSELRECVREILAAMHDALRALRDSHGVHVEEFRLLTQKVNDTGERSIEREFEFQISVIEQLLPGSE